VRPASKHQVNSYVRPFLASAMIAGGLLQLAAPIYAAGTVAGADINNTATASYQDPNDTSATAPTLYTISNTVSVKVEKVAGIFIQGSGATDITDAGKYKAGDTVNFDFLITNKGNSAVKFSIPGAATVSTAGTFQKVQYFVGVGVTGADAAGYKDITTGGATNPAVMPNVAVDGTMKARVVVVVNTPINAANPAPLTVQLGKTANAPVVGAPVDNDERTSTNSNTEDVYTVDIENDAAVAPLGKAINNVREAAAIQSVSVNAVNKAFVDINMTGAVTTSDPDPTKNKITYDLTVKVDPNAPTTGPDAGKNPSDLGATAIKLDPGTGATIVNRVLISNPVPTGTTPTALVAPTGLKAPDGSPVVFIPVYSLSPVGTAVADIVWQTGTLPTSGVNFVGFVKSDDQPLPKSPDLYSGFQVVLQTTGASTTVATTVNNVANIFGTTPNADKTPDFTKPIVDQTGTPGVNDSIPGTPVGIPVTIIPSGTRVIFNGPVNAPEATGADGKFDSDFTNKSAVITVGEATVTDSVTGALTPSTQVKTVSFNNTVENKGTAPTDIYLLPTAPANKADLRNGTLVKITYLGENRTYTYDNTGTVGTFTPVAAEAVLLPIVIPGVLVGSSNTKDYGVSVTLPANTPQLKGYTVPITAFADAAAPAPGATTVPASASSNITIDTVYTGYLKLSKEARILDSVAEATTSTKAFSTNDPTSPALEKPKPGQFIQYRIKYENISNVGGTGSVVLDAGKVKIVEDGAAGTNTWGAVTNNAPGSAKDTKNGTISFFNGTASSADVAAVNKYEMNFSSITKVTPGTSGFFSFLREVK
jgi:hypothetical protein